MQDTERSECTTQETQEYYRKDPATNLTLVTGRALFGIKSIGGHLKHVVALDADAMKNRTGDGLQLG